MIILQNNKLLLPLTITIFNHFQRVGRDNQQHHRNHIGKGILGRKARRNSCNAGACQKGHDVDIKKIKGHDDGGKIGLIGPR